MAFGAEEGGSKEEVGEVDENILAWSSCGAMPRRFRRTNANHRKVGTSSTVLRLSTLETLPSTQNERYLLLDVVSDAMTTLPHARTMKKKALK